MTGVQTCALPIYRLEVDDWARAAASFTSEVQMVEPSMIELEPGSDIADIVARLVQAGIRVRAVEPQKPNLESLYLDAITRKRGAEHTVVPAEREEAVR